MSSGYFVFVVVIFLSDEEVELFIIVVVDCFVGYDVRVIDGKYCLVCEFLGFS